jgi:hypothetical protein
VGLQAEEKSLLEAIVNVILKMSHFNIGHIDVPLERTMKCLHDVLRYPHSAATMGLYLQTAAGRTWKPKSDKNRLEGRG